MMPHIYHYIQATDKHTGQSHTQKHYSFGMSWGPRSEPWWSTYRYGLCLAIATRGINQED
jgi:hypothetical protein